MSILDRYIFRTSMVAFLATLLTLTAVIWTTQALREFDLLTAKRQTILVFLAVTSLSIPALITIIAPVAVFIATLYTLNKLNGDSELIVMSAAGLPPKRLLRPFLALTVLASLLVSTMTLWAMPASFRDLRDLLTHIRADFLTKIVKEGQFTTLDAGITFHYREKSGEALLGIFMQDRRDKDKVSTYIAERGQTTESDGVPYLVLEKGSVQADQPGGRSPNIVTFERYAIDLSQFGSDGDVVTYKPRERSTGEILGLDMNDPYVKANAGRFRAELHDRLSAPLYPFAFMALGLAGLGAARTTRQGRGMAIAGAVVAVIALRIAGFAASSLIVRAAWAVPLVYLIPLAGTAIGLVGLLNPGLFQRKSPRVPRAARLQAARG
ncbi:LPS export ABC transporter permease LptF [Alsobacter sp. SYSU M60028]|uniref:LPS export ABC transporter permease LptF n=1 Tax=Alsobacter ponti TaxID=2962936 RepID=A0ABT1LFJ1_9HYPH|nr:LPS export ABC transporter permease LptF [Alsobacter ponti]MCP8940267.1 LPS export ABC transporter permease LptF [Alsobacter ponti]